MIQQHAKIRNERTALEHITNNAPGKHASQVSGEQANIFNGEHANIPNGEHAFEPTGAHAVEATAVLQADQLLMLFQFSKYKNTLN
jgi:hypothetical protein